MKDSLVPMCLVGCGGMGSRHVAGYAALQGIGLSNVELVGVCDLKAENAARVAALAEECLGRRPEVFLSLEHALSRGSIVAFDVVTEADTHLAVAGTILRAGRHVLCEKPLGITVRACRALVRAARDAGVILATAENYRRDPVNRLAKAVLRSGLLGRVHLMSQFMVGGTAAIMVTPWRHLKQKGAIGLDMGVHHTDIIQYFLGPFDLIAGRGLIAEPVRHAPTAPGRDSPAYRALHASLPQTVAATGEDSVLALFTMASGVSAQLAYIPSGPGHAWFQRTLHGSEGSLSVPKDRTGDAVILRTGRGQVVGRALLALLPDFTLDPVTRALFGADGVTYAMAFEHVDAALLAIEIHDMADAIVSGRRPEVDGDDGMAAVAAVLGAYESGIARRTVSMTEILDGTVDSYQRDLDQAFGLA